jgi:hypothetical protein
LQVGDAGCHVHGVTERYRDFHYSDSGFMNERAPKTFEH